MELETEEIFQRARPLPMVRHWLTRCVVVAVASLATPFVADLLHPAGESPPAEATDVRHAEGTNHEGSRVVDMQWSLLLLLVLIGLALVLERLREVLKESLAKHAAVVERIWSELAVLGALSLTSHMLVQGGALGRVSLLAYGDEAHEAYLLRRFEAVHRSLLCGLASFLLCALLLLRAAVVAERQWGSYEAFIACYTLGGTAAADAAAAGAGAAIAGASSCGTATGRFGRSDGFLAEGALRNERRPMAGVSQRVRCVLLVVLHTLRSVREIGKRVQARNLVVFRLQVFRKTRDASEIHNAAFGRCSGGRGRRGHIFRGAHNAVSGRRSAQSTICPR